MRIGVVLLWLLPTLNKCFPSADVSLRLLQTSMMEVFVKSHCCRREWLVLLSPLWRAIIVEEIGLSYFLFGEEPLFSRLACAAFSFVKSHYFWGEWLVLLSPLWRATIFEESGLCYFLLCEEPLCSRRVACGAFSLVNSHCFRGEWLVVLSPLWRATIFEEIGFLLCSLLNMLLNIMLVRTINHK